MVGGEEELTETEASRPEPGAQSPPEREGQGRVPLPKNLGPTKGVASALCQCPCLHVCPGEGRGMGLVC